MGSKKRNKLVNSFPPSNAKVDSHTVPMREQKSDVTASWPVSLENEDLLHNERCIWREIKLMEFESHKSLNAIRLHNDMVSYFDICSSHP